MYIYQQLYFADVFQCLIFIYYVNVHTSTGNTSNKNYNNQKCTSRLQVEYVITKSNPKSYVHIKSNPKYKIKS